MSTTTDKVSVIARLVAEEGKRDELVAIFEKFIADAVSQEEGTESYVLYADEANADAVWIVEHYRDRGALDAHMGNPAFMELLGSLAGVATADTQLNTAIPLAGKGITL